MKWLESRQLKIAPPKRTKKITGTRFATILGLNPWSTPLQIKGLKAVLKKLKDADPTKEEMIAQIAVQTEGFTSISKSDCETLIQKITAMLEGGNE